MVNTLPVVSSSVEMERGWHSMFSGGQRSAAGVEVNEKSALGYAPFWRAVNLISGDVAGMPCDVFRRQRDGGKKYDKKHPAATLLRDMASPWWRADEMRKVLTAHALVHGNGYGPIVRDMSGAPVAIGLLDPCGVMVRVLDNGEKWYIYYENGEPRRIPARDMIHIKGLARDGITGYSIITLMANALGVGMAAQEFGGKFFSNGSTMSGILMVPGHFSEEKIRNTMSAWDQMHRGLSKSHKVGLLQDGVKWQPLSVTNDQAQFLQTREFEVRQTISNITGVPPHMLGDATRTSHNSLESESQSYLHRCLNPWLKEWEAELRSKLLTERQRQEDSHIIEFNREAEIQMSFADKINGIYREIECGLMTPNEGRRLLNMPSAGPDGDKFYRPANWMEVGEEDESMDDPAPQQPATPPDPQSDPEETPKTGGMEDVLRSLITSSVTKDLQIERDRVVQRAGMRATKFTEAIGEFYTTWTRETAAALTATAARTSIMAHAEESKRILTDVHAVSTTASLKANVQDTVASWDVRGEALIESLLRTVGT